MIGRKFRETMNKLNILLPLVLCLINFICICFTYRISPICTLMLLLCQISFFFSGTLYYFTHKKAMQKIFKDLLIYMDQMIDGYTIDEQETLEDTFISQVYHKLYKLYNILQSKQQRIEDERDKLQSFISDISHQIKTPLTNLNLIQETLMQDVLSPNKRIEYLNLQLSQIEKLNFLIQALLKSSKLENGIINLSPKYQSINDTIFSSIEAIIGAAESKNISIVYNTTNDYIVAHDKKWLGEALINLLDNAIKYTLPNGKVSILLTTTKDYIILSIQDTGIGITEEELPYIFKRFWRGSETKTDGNGIGLYLCQKIVALHNGFILVDSAIYKGSCFSIYLPKYRTHENRIV